MIKIGTKIVEVGSTAGGTARVDYKTEGGTTVFGFDDTAQEITGTAVTTTGEAGKLLKFSSIANTLLHFLRIRKSSTTALNVQDDSSVDVFNVDTTNKVITSYNQKISGLAGTGSRMIMADASGNLSASTNFSKKSFITTTAGTPYVVGDVNDYRANSIFEITVTGKTASLAGEYKKVMLHSDADGNPYVRTIISGGTGTITIGTGGTGQFTVTTSISGEYIVLISNI